MSQRGRRHCHYYHQLHTIAAGTWVCELNYYTIFIHICMYLFIVEKPPVSRRFMLWYLFKLSEWATLYICLTKSYHQIIQLLLLLTFLLYAHYCIVQQRYNFIGWGGLCVYLSCSESLLPTDTVSWVDRREHGSRKVTVHGRVTVTATVEAVATVLSSVYDRLTDWMTVIRGFSDRARLNWDALRRHWHLWDVNGDWSCDTASSYVPVVVVQYMPHQFRDH